MCTTRVFGKYRIVLIAICANLVSFVVGTYVGWTSPVMPRLRNQTADSPLSVGVTLVQEGWISSLTSIGAFVVSLFIGSLATLIGRKWALLLSSLVFAISFVLLLLATDVWFMYVARFLQGVGGGAVNAVMPMYIGEIATDDTRGAIGSLMTIFTFAGVLFVYIIGPYVSYMALQWCCLVFPILAFTIFFFMPETPYYFAMKGKKLEGINSLKCLRGKNTKDVEDEMAKIQSDVDEAMSNKGSIIDIARNSGYRKALFIGCGLLLFQQMTGSAAVTFNSQSIFISAGSSLDPAISTIILGIVQLVSNLLTPFVVERAGRKIILLVSSIGMGMSLIALGTFFYIQAFGSVSGILWLPVPALVVFYVFFGFGFGPVPWAVLGEMFPSNIKSTATSVACSSTWLLGFVITRWFPELNALGAYYAFWIFGGFCVLAIFFVQFVVIETKGLSLQMIQAKLQGGLK